MRQGLVHGRGRETGGGGERSGGRDRLALRRAVNRPPSAQCPLRMGLVIRMQLTGSA